MRTWLRLICVLLVGLWAASARAADRALNLAATASVADSGLLDALLPELEKDTGVKVRVIAVPSATALRMAGDGRADVVLCDDPAAEEALLRSHALLARHPLMEDFDLIVGPPDDPAKALEATSGVDAFRRMAAAKVAYIGRADDSAQNARESLLLEAAGLDATTGWPGFTSTKAGLAQVLLEAGQKKAYALSDLSTFLMFQKRTGLARISRADDDLRNVYALLTVNPEKFPGKIEIASANQLVEWFLRATTARKIADFGQRKYDEPLYRPLNLDSD
jgi:tungstate transport system substrate-binding protein